MCESGLSKMEELILCENLGVCGYVCVGRHYTCTWNRVWVIYLHSCSVLGCRRYISGLWRDVCIEFVCLFKGHGHWEEYLLGPSVFFSRGPLSLCILES